MVKIPKKVQERMRKGLKKYQSILQTAHDKDIKESDTVLVITDMLAEVFGYAKYEEITTEYAIKGTYCDLAIKRDDKPIFLIEVKAIGIQLKDKHLRQALDYAVNEGVEWVILTNGIDWHVYKTIFKKPISKELVFNINLLESSPQDPKVIESLFVLSKEGLKKSAIAEFQEEKNVMNRFTIASLIESDPAINLLRRELKKMHKGKKIDRNDLRAVIRNDVLKRDVVEGEEAAEARKKMNRGHSKKKRSGKMPEGPQLKDGPGVEVNNPG